MTEAVETKTIVSDPWPDMTAREAEVWTDRQIPYENRANHTDTATRAKAFALAVVKEWEADSANYVEEWRWLDYVLKGNSPNQGNMLRNVHVPEVLKAYLSMLPRIEEAMMGNGRRWFEVRGRDRIDRRRADGLSAFLEWQLAQTRYRQWVSPSIGSFLKYQVACLKVAWERKVEERVYHWIEEEATDKGDLLQHHKRQKKDVVTFEGNRVRMVHPYDFVIDLRRFDERDANYCGDFSFPTLDDLFQMQDQGILMNVEEVRTKRDQSRTARVRTQPSNRMGASDGQEMGHLEGGVVRPEILDLYCLFDLENNRRWKPCVITLADGGTVLRVMENPNDRKHAPYAVGRSSANGTTFYDIGVLTPAMPLNAEYDHHRANVLESHELTIAPRVFLEGPGPSDLPNNMYASKPGDVYKNCGRLSFQTIPNTLQAASYIDGSLRRDIEEVTGATRFWQGGEGMPGQNTATEVNRKIEESNRRLLSHIRNYAYVWEGVLKIMHWNMGQFMTDKTRFRVLDKQRAQVLGESYVISPQDLLEDVDFEFQGVDQVQTYGLRGTNLLTFFQTAEPVLASMPNEFNLPAMVRQLYRLLVGEEAQDEIVRPQTRIEDLMSQSDENRLLLQGLTVQTDELDDDAGHLKDMIQHGLMDRLKNPKTPKPVRLAIYAHAYAHTQALVRKRAQAQAVQQKNQRLAMQQPPQPAEPGQPTREGEGAYQTNGSGTPQQVGKAGRQSNITQDRNVA